jgi:hypothetical protein
VTVGWDPAIVAEYRRQFISAKCRQCFEPCCVFGDHRLGTFALPLKPEAMHALCEGVIATRWPVGTERAKALLRSGATSILDGPCPAFTGRRCILYDSPVRPEGCEWWPIWDRREEPDGTDEQVVGCVACPELDNGGVDHARRWLEKRSGVPLEVIWDLDSQNWFFIIER